MTSAAPCLAGSAVNIPLESRIYRDLERLEVKGLLTSAILSTKPFTASEGARLLREAEAAYRSGERKSFYERELISRLKSSLNGSFEDGQASYIKPVDSLSASVIYSGRDPFFIDLNNNGDSFREGFNARFGYSLEAGLGGVLSFYLNPEYRADEESSEVRLLRGNATLSLGALEIEAGRDSMWWGPGYHGGLLVTNNAKPFDIVKVTSARPFLLPGHLGKLGLLKPTLFLTRLEEERDFPGANLLGMRLDFKVTPRFQLGLGRVFMFGGEGRRSLTTGEWLKVFFASDGAEHADSPINGNQLASIDASYVYVNDSKWLPFSGIKLYTEWGAEDSSGETKTPTGRANIYGAFIDEPFRAENIDLRVEWANTARSERYGPRWYKHGVYTTGYTYEGNVIGHHMGGDSTDLFLRAQYHTAGGDAAGVEADSEDSGIHGLERTKKLWVGADYTKYLGENFYLKGGAGYEKIKTQAGSDGSVALWASAVISF